MSYGKYAPNPQFERADYQFLCGAWDFAFGNGEQKPVPDKKIIVPYSYESKASGIGDENIYGCVWYERTFTVKAHSGRILLHFEAVDYEAIVSVNGVEVGSHRGGFTHFCFDITKYVHTGENILTVEVHDSLDKSQLRGKQRSLEHSYDCWYVQTTGIWKPVWLEYAGSVLIQDIRIRTANDGNVEAEIELDAPAHVTVELYDGETLVARGKGKGRDVRISMRISAPRLWSVGEPNLYYAKVRTEGKSPDEVHTYFAFREICLKKDGVYINGKREFQQMVLDQGYWPDTMLTAPDEEALERDVQLIKEMGFNGVRKHQKVESAVFYYLCDKYGLYVWGEIPSPYSFDSRMQTEYLRDSADIVRQLRGHPSIICWLLFNEAWGVYSINESKEVQAFIEDAAEAVRHLDNRPIITNDGWYHLDSDILSLHEYEQNAAMLSAEYSRQEHVISEKIINENRYGRAFASGYSYSGQPIIISEYGGVAIRGNGWGYGEGATDIDAYEHRVRDIVDAVCGLGYISGCCYTQLTDVQQEANGLLTAERMPKLPITKVREIFTVNR